MYPLSPLLPPGAARPPAKRTIKRISTKPKNYYFYLVSDAKSSEPEIHFFRGERPTEEYLMPSEYIASVPYT
ncbi:hypothetical protein J2129_002398 [Methanofollis sp. W23]|uniref:hypothetical protein n=1 Tax=Methanofollis sp. W23 TaxID=2817849 RepID=UPI001AE74E92|nr:hypothetical protein [Methanofollis sp. W23]MBP2146944.1 hypothetical protein [Methanofollis sp. W23]